MRPQLIALGLTVLLGGPLPLQAQPLDGPASLEHRVRERRDALTARYGLVWPDTTLPRVVIGFPDSIPSTEDILRAVSYTYEPRTIWINPLALSLNDSANAIRRYIHDVVRRQFGDFNPRLDHELAHDYYGQTYHRLTGRTKPRIKGDWYVANLLAHKLMSEGLATAVERPIIPPDTTAESWPIRINLYPKEANQLPTDWEDLCYEGGWKLFAPLLKEFGLAAVTEYIIQHPLEFNANAIRSQIVAWRAQAWADLQAQQDHQ